jgi:hypothetical protein
MNLTPPRRIAILGNISDGLDLAWQERYALAWPALTLFLIDLFIARFGPPQGILTIRLDQLGHGTPNPNDPFFAVISLLVGLLDMSFIVGIQRRVLLGEQRTGFQLFNFGAPFLHNVMAAIILCLAGVAMALAVALPTWFISLRLEQPAHSLVKVVGSLATIYLTLRVLLRLMLTLPAASVGLPDATATMWRLTKHVWWRLLGIVVLLMLLAIAVDIPELLFGLLDDALGIPNPATASYGAAQLGWFAATWSALISLVVSICTGIITALCYREVMNEAAQSQLVTA